MKKEKNREKNEKRKEPRKNDLKMSLNFFLYQVSSIGRTRAFYICDSEFKFPFGLCSCSSVG